MLGAAYLLDGVVASLWGGVVLGAVIGVVGTILYWQDPVVLRLFGIGLLPWSAAAAALAAAPSGPGPRAETWRLGVMTLLLMVGSGLVSAAGLGWVLEGRLRRVGHHFRITRRALRYARREIHRRSAAVESHHLQRLTRHAERLQATLLRADTLSAGQLRAELSGLAVGVRQMVHDPALVTPLGVAQRRPAPDGLLVGDLPMLLEQFVAVDRAASAEVLTGDWATRRLRLDEGALLASLFDLLEGVAGTTTPGRPLPYTARLRLSEAPPSLIRPGADRTIVQVMILLPATTATPWAVPATHLPPHSPAGRWRRGVLRLLDHGGDVEGALLNDIHGYLRLYLPLATDRAVSAAQPWGIVAVRAAGHRWALQQALGRLAIPPERIVSLTDLRDLMLQASAFAHLPDLLCVERDMVAGVHQTLEGVWPSGECLMCRTLVIGSGALPQEGGLRTPFTLDEAIGALERRVLTPCTTCAALGHEHHLAVAR